MLCISENEATYFRHLTILAQTSLCHSVDVKQPHICLTWSIMMRYWLEVKAALVKLTCYNFFFFFSHCAIKCSLGMVDLSPKRLELGK